MDNELIAIIKQKKEFSNLPDSLVWEFSKKCGGGVKETRSLLRKFFGVFLTNKVMKGDGVDILKHHKSSMDRDYEEYYSKLLDNVGKVKTIIDLGCGVNGFSYNFLKSNFGDVKYVGVEAVGQLVNKMNEYFNKEKIMNAKAIWGDLFDMQVIKDIVTYSKRPVCIMLLQSIDAMESLRKDSSKSLLLSIKDLLGKSDFIVIISPRKIVNSQNISQKYLQILTDNYKTFNYSLDTNFDEFLKLPNKKIVICCTKSVSKIYEKLITYDVNNITTWFDEAHWGIEEWVNNLDNSITTINSNIVILQNAIL